MLDLDDPEIRLAISYAPRVAQAGVTALFALDALLWQLARSGRDPMVAQLRLTWWHDALLKLDTAPPPAEPILQALAKEVAQSGISGAALAGLVEGWEVLLDAPPVDLALVAQRGAALFALAAQRLGDPAPSAAVAAGGGAWALADYARHAADATERERALDALRAATPPPATRWPRALRTLGALAVLALWDGNRAAGRNEPQAAPARILRMAAMALFGR